MFFSPLPASLPVSAAMSLRPSARAEVRKKAYKVSVDADEARRKREDNLVEIRKNKREENLLKKRKEGMTAQQMASITSVQSNSVEKKVCENLYMCRHKLSAFSLGFFSRNSSFGSIVFFFLL